MNKLLKAVVRTLRDTETANEQRTGQEALSEAHRLGATHAEARRGETMRLRALSNTRILQGIAHQPRARLRHRFGEARTAATG